MELRIGVLDIPTSKFGTPQEGLEEQLIKTVKYNRLDVLVGPEHLFRRPDRFYTEEEAEKLIRRLKDGTKGKKTLILPGTVDCLYSSTIPALHSGKQLWKTLPIKKKGIEIGFEIGESHEKGILKSMAPDEVDLHIVIAYGQEVEENNVIARPGRYVLICNGNVPETRCYVREDSGSLTETLFRERDGILKIYPLNF